MSNVAVRVENLSKLYHIGGPQESYQTFRDAITRTVSAPFRRMRDIVRGQSAANLKEEIWALKDVSFEVKHGEVVGIIGRNGAGKSTLLKILSRITEPTTGYADVYGRVGALLEVGTGFHPELTGRENVYLNGAILGMSRRDIERKFDEIVDFAGVERFIDTPVKHYSSGMGLRLGFSVAAHLEPEILVVDEVLAVGDAEFQKKCLGKMGQVAGEGRTVLLVSHNLAAVNSICTSGILIEQGQINFKGTTLDATDIYMNNVLPEMQQLPLSERTDRVGDLEVKLSGFSIEDELGQQIEVIPTGLNVRFVFEVQVSPSYTGGRVDVAINFRSIDGRVVCTYSSLYTKHHNFEIKPKIAVVATINRFPIAPGRYLLDSYIFVDGRATDVMQQAISFEVIDGDFYHSGRQLYASDTQFLLNGDWFTESRVVS
jgi:lipopolysaccharide transport system ATP-binding protein